MERTNERWSSIGCGNFNTVAKARSWPNPEMTACCFVTEGTEAYHHGAALHQVELSPQEARAGIAFIDRWLIRWRRAAHGGGHPGVAEFETVVDRHRRRLIRKANGVH